MKYTFNVEMTYKTKTEIEAEDQEEADQKCVDMIGDGILLRDVELLDFEIESV